MPIGIMAAMQEEIDTLLKELSAGSEAVNEGRRTYHSGHLWGAPVVLVFSRWGKVAAATTATDLISDFCVSEILFTGVAGAAQPALRVGDIVVGARLWQHDMDARPLFPQHEIPLLGRSSFASDEKRRNQLLQAAAAFLRDDLRQWSPKPPEPRSMSNHPRRSRETSPAATNFSHTAPSMPICSSVYRRLLSSTWRARPLPKSATSTASHSRSCGPSPMPPTNPPPTISRSFSSR
jgi:nucleoside phosphorylase